MTINFFRFFKVAKWILIFLNNYSVSDSNPGFDFDSVSDSNSDSDFDSKSVFMNLDVFIFFILYLHSSK